MQALTLYKGQEDQVLQAMQTYRTPFYSCYSGRSTQGGKCAYNDGNISKTVPGAVEGMRSFLQTVSPGECVYIVLSEKDPSSKSGGGNTARDLKYIYCNEPRQDGQQSYSSGAVSGYDQSRYIDKDVMEARLQLEQMRAEMKMEALKRELEEIKKEGQPSAFENAAIGVLPQLMQAFTGKAPTQPQAVNGPAVSTMGENQPQAEPSETVNPDIENRLNEAVGQLLELEGEQTADHLELLCKLRQQKPDQYKMALDMAKSMVS